MHNTQHHISPNIIQKKDHKQLKIVIYVHQDDSNGVIATLWEQLYMDRVMVCVSLRIRQDLAIQDFKK